MSGASVGRALARRFAIVARTEVERLRRKFNHLDDDEQCLAVALVFQVSKGLARVPTQTLATEQDQSRLEAIVRLFDLHDPE